MSDITISFIGTGDAFGSGGRLQACILVDAPGVRFALDFGCTSLVGLRKLGINPNSIDGIILTHFHGDHCGGVPFLLMDGMLGAKRDRELTIAGPAGTVDHLSRLHEVLFPGSGVMVPRFPVNYIELMPNRTVRLMGLELTAIEARHTAETIPLAFRIEVSGRSIAYTGDGELTEDLKRLADGVDLLIAESYFHSKKVGWHLNYPDVKKLTAKKTVLTHMHSEMLGHAPEVPEVCACDGFTMSI